MTLALAASPPNVQWKGHASAPEGVSGGAWARLGDKLIYAGGTTWRGGVKHWLRTTAAYTTSADTWSVGPPLPEDLAYGPYVGEGHMLEIFGGMNQDGPSLHCWRLHENSSRWESSGVLAAPTVLAKAGNLSGTPFIFGGCKDANDLRSCSQAVWKRTERGDWVGAGTMPIEGLAMPAFAAVSGRAYLFGGCSAKATGEVVNRSDAYRYDAGTSAWKSLRPLPRAARGLAAVALNTRQILLLGGVEGNNPSLPEFSKSVFVYDIERDRYEDVASLPFGVMGLEALFDGHSIWGMGGEDKARSRSARLLRGILSDSEPQTR
jgi:N-acetylneuraminic acid mutarotase